MIAFFRRLISRLTSFSSAEYTTTSSGAPALTRTERKVPSDWATENTSFETNVVVPWLNMTAAPAETAPDTSKLSQNVDSRLTPNSDISKLSISATAPFHHNGVTSAKVSPLSPKPPSGAFENKKRESQHPSPIAPAALAAGDVSGTGIGVEGTPPMSAARLSRSRVSGISIASSRPAPPSPSPSRHHSLNMPSNAPGPRSRPVSNAASLASSNTSKSRFSVGLLTASPSDVLTPSLSGNSGVASGKRKSTRKSASSRFLAAAARSPVILVRDFAYGKTDERHAATLTASSYQNQSQSRRSSGFGMGSSRWSGFASRFGWGSRNNSGDRLSQSRLSGQYANAPTYPDILEATPTQRSTLGTGAGFSITGYDESPEASEEDDEESEAFDDSLPESPGEFVPGLYRAIFPFVAEGAAEMDLTEEQLVNVLGRGGGDGWVVVATEDGGQALVPESYLELVVPFSPMLEQSASQHALVPPDFEEERNNNERSTTPHAQSDVDMDFRSVFPA